MLVALSYTASEAHASIGPLFYPVTQGVKDYAKTKFQSKLTYMENTSIADKSFVVGNSFTVADAYLTIVLSWCPYVGIDLAPYPKVKAYFDKITSLGNWVEAKTYMDTVPSFTSNNFNSVAAASEAA
jgi:glutathione S-transferase